MKKYILLCSLLVILIFLFSCNGGTKTTEGSQTDSGQILQNPEAAKVTKAESILIADIQCTGISNFYIEEAVAKDMISHFRGHFHERVNQSAMIHFIDSVWIDSCVIVSLGDFFDTTKYYDGMRIVSGARGNNKNTVFLVPTSNSVGALHPEVWGNKIPIPCTASNNNYAINIPKPIGMIRSFGSFYRRERSPGNPHNGADYDSISAKIWFSGCVFKVMRDVLKKPNEKLDGIMVYFAAYKTRQQGGLNNFQKYDNQSSIVLVPTNPHPDGINHIPNWAVVKSSVMVNATDEEKRKLGALNHGQLCPNNCD